MTKIDYNKDKSVLWNATNRAIVYVNRVEIMPKGTRATSLNEHQYLDPEQAKSELLGLFNSYIIAHLYMKVDPLMYKCALVLYTVADSFKVFNDFNTMKDAVLKLYNKILELEA